MAAGTTGGGTVATTDSTRRVESSYSEVGKREKCLPEESCRSLRGGDWGRRGGSPPPPKEKSRRWRTPPLKSTVGRQKRTPRQPAEEKMEKDAQSRRRTKAKGSARQNERARKDARLQPMTERLSQRPRFASERMRGHAAVLGGFAVGTAALTVRHGPGNILITTCN